MHHHTQQTSLLISGSFKFQTQVYHMAPPFPIVLQTLINLTWKTNSFRKHFSFPQLLSSCIKPSTFRNAEKTELTPQITIQLPFPPLSSLDNSSSIQVCVVHTTGHRANLKPCLPPGNGPHSAKGGPKLLIQLLVCVCAHNMVRDKET